MEWTEKHDIYLCREIIVVEPFQFKKGTVDRGKLWTKIAESLNSCKEIKFRVGMRSVRERFTDIQKEYLKKNKADESSSGTSNDITELDQLLEEISEKEKVAEENRDSDKDRKKVDADRAKAEEARRVAMERIGQTKKRQKDEGEDQEERKRPRRRSGGDTVEYLREKCEMERNLREKELEVKKAELADQAARAQEQKMQMQEMIQVMQQQQQQNQNMQTLLLQQQQQQSQAILALINSLTNKPN